VLEGTSFGVRHNLKAMVDAGADVARLIAVGGGTQGELWTQIVSDVTATPQDLCEQTVGACLGDAMLAAMAIGTGSDVWSWNPVARRLAPDPNGTLATTPSTPATASGTSRRRASRISWPPSSTQPRARSRS
jgi:sugar (pentulose or hexulose) kinase